MRRSCGGFTLIEFVIVIAMMLSLAILVLLYAENGRIAAAVNKEVSIMGTAHGRIGNLFVSQGSFANINNSLLVAAKIFTDVSGTDIRNSWGGAVVVAPTVLAGRPNAAYSWTSNNVPQAECIDLITAVDELFVEVRVNTVVVKPYLGVLNKTLLADVTACSASTLDNQVVFVAM